ncbi:hypothetical protein NPIL_323651 [Nephila pilipes]|uniref:Uncharacterized protein n=1 Tax=Nephila pilipes TaxID=299642 RepID=A0A8X6QX76_NEPPI|nr:hypothetical protein NPIL_323651 [Nephila pilipes]
MIEFGQSLVWESREGLKLGMLTNPSRAWMFTFCLEEEGKKWWMDPTSHTFQNDIQKRTTRDISTKFTTGFSQNGRRVQTLKYLKSPTSLTDIIEPQPKCQPLAKFIIHPPLLMHSPAPPPPSGNPGLTTELPLTAANVIVTGPSIRPGGPFN